MPRLRWKYQRHTPRFTKKERRRKRIAKQAFYAMCPYHNLCFNNKEDNSQKNDQKHLMHVQDEKHKIRIKIEDESETPCIAVEDGYSNSGEVDPLAEEDPTTDEDPPVTSFISFVEIKEEPQDVTFSSNGEMSSPHEEHLSSSENSSFSSCMCHLYHSMAEDMEQIRRAKAAASRRECRRRQLANMTEEQKKAKHKEEARAQKRYRQRKLESMTEEQRRAYRAAVAESQRMRRRLRMESMTEEELKAYRAEAAATQRRKRALQRQKMTDEELQMHRAVEAALRRYRRQANAKKEIGSHRRAAAKARREIQQCQMEERLEDIEQYVEVATSAQRDLQQYRGEYDLDAQQPDVMEEDTTPENLMVQLLMQAQQHAEALQCVQGEHTVIKQEIEDGHYSQQETMPEEPHLNACMFGQPQEDVTKHENKDSIYEQGSMTEHVNKNTLYRY